MFDIMFMTMSQTIYLFGSRFIIIQVMLLDEEMLAVTFILIFLPL